MEQTSFKQIPKDVFKIASDLDQFNKERQLLEKNVFNQILQEIEKNLSEPIIIISGHNWHEGVIGIVAARIKEKLNNPLLLYRLKNIERICKIYSRL